MNTAIVFTFFLCWAAADQFRWESCTKDTSTRALKYTCAHASPMPVVLPGPLTVTFSVEVLRKIEAVQLYFNFTRITSLGINVPVPCINNRGSCMVDGCSLVYNMIYGKWQDQRNIGKQFLQMFASVGVPTTCPIQKQNITVTNFTFQLPTPFSDLLYGNYIVEVTAKEPVNQRELGCLRLWASLEAKSTGFLFGK